MKPTAITKIQHEDYKINKIYSTKKYNILPKRIRRPAGAPFEETILSIILFHSLSFSFILFHSLSFSFILFHSLSFSFILFHSLLFLSIPFALRLGPTTIYDRINVIDGDGGLCNVRAQNDFSDLGKELWRRPSSDL